jgi:hypothetical protein
VHVLVLVSQQIKVAKNAERRRVVTLFHKPLLAASHTRSDDERQQLILEGRLAAVVSAAKVAVPSVPVRRVVVDAVVVVQIVPVLVLQQVAVLLALCMRDRCSRSEKAGISAQW